MNILLDTCTFLWIITEADELSEKARELFINPDNAVYLSAVSEWEMAVKYSLGRLPLPQNPLQYIPDQRKKHAIVSLSLDEESALHLTRLPDIHKDPFDRMLISQALVHGFVILSPDEFIYQYPARVIW
ncbi:hypothetical protein ES703_89720 [subsurface metagenome]